MGHVRWPYSRTGHRADGDFDEPPCATAVKLRAAAGGVHEERRRRARGAFRYCGAQHAAHGIRVVESESTRRRARVQAWSLHRQILFSMGVARCGGVWCIASMPLRRAIEYKLEESPHLSLNAQQVCVRARMSVCLCVFVFCLRGALSASDTRYVVCVAQRLAAYFSCRPMGMRRCEELPHALLSLLALATAVQVRCTI